MRYNKIFMFLIITSSLTSALADTNVLPYYVGLMSSRIKHHMQNQNQSCIKLNYVAELTLNEQGLLVNKPSITEKSGNDDCDALLLEAITSSQPFDLPDEPNLRKKLADTLRIKLSGSLNKNPKILSVDKKFSVAIDANFLNGRLPRIVGITNLPDGVELLVSLRSTKNKYYGDTKTTVSNGSFGTESFTNQYRPLSPGSYEIQITMTPASFTPEQVKLFGEKGEKLEGDFIVPLLTQSKWLDFRKWIVIQ